MLIIHNVGCETHKSSSSLVTLFRIFSIVSFRFVVPQPLFFRSLLIKSAIPLQTSPPQTDIWTLAQPGSTGQTGILTEDLPDRQTDWTDRWIVHTEILDRWTYWTINQTYETENYGVQTGLFVATPTNKIHSTYMYTKQEIMQCLLPIKHLLYLSHVKTATAR
jgi:hypothetical protein